MEKRYSQDIEGEVTYIPTDRGGRSVPAYSGYRPQFFYNGNDWDAVQHFPDVEKVNPGDTVKVIFTFLSPEEHFGNLEEGTIFLIREGSRTIGYGKVTRILELEKSATKAMESEKRG